MLLKFHWLIKQKEYLNKKSLYNENNGQSKSNQFMFDEAQSLNVIFI
jgi:hypothetical protein